MSPFYCAVVLCFIIGVTRAQQVLQTPHLPPKHLSLVAPKALDGLWTNCGVSQHVDLNFAGCTTTPCQLSVGQSYDLDVTFRPSAHHWIMILQTVIIKDETYEYSTLFNGQVPDSILEPGQEYNFRYNFVVPSAFTGASEFRLILSENWIQEVCFHIPVNIAN